MPKIEKIYAFIHQEKNGDEGIVGFLNPATRQWMPLTGADMKRVESLMPIAQDLANTHGMEIKLIEFEVRRDIKTIKPYGKG